MKDQYRQENILATANSFNQQGLKWLNKPDKYLFGENGLSITVGSETDFFNDPSTRKINANAPFLYMDMSGDFVATALLKPDFSDMWNAMSIMVHINESNWIKFAFEKSDATGKSIVTVVTRDISDDANGAILEKVDMVWLKLARKNDIYSMHWSIDGNDYKMARLSAMPYSDTVKVGIEAQCPVGKSATHEALFFSVEELTINDLRNIQE
jgi:regulation of enolase protein 1 (concanavalin A-like superfamily)